MTQYVISDFDSSSDKKETLACSSTPTKMEQKISAKLTESFDENYGNRYRKEGYQKVNFSVEIKKNTIVVTDSFWIRDNGDVEIINIGHKHRVKGHSISTRLKKKVSNLAMSINLPTPFLLFHKEIQTSFMDGFMFKFGLATFIGTIFSLSELTISQMVNSLIFLTFVAIIDAVLGILPNTVKGKRAKKDHTILTKVWLWVSAMLVMVGLFGIHIFLKNLLLEPNILQEFFIRNIFNIGAIGVIITYFIRITGYYFVANKRKVPAAIAGFFKK